MMDPLPLHRFPDYAVAGLVAVAAIICTALGMSSCGRSPIQITNKNVILISVDTLRADRLNCYGYKTFKVSPNIDALADDGILFENFITASPWTTPAHLSMLTSLNPSTHGVITSFRDVWRGLFEGLKFPKLQNSRVTLAEVLKTNGYGTGAFTAGGTLDPKIGFDQGFDQYRTSMFKMNKRNMTAMRRWVRRAARKKFFLFWHNFEVHAPYLKGDFLKGVLPRGIAEPLKIGMDRLTSFSSRKVWPAGPTRLRKKQLQLLRDYQVYTANVCDALYVGGILSVDRWLGQLMDMLKKTGLYDSSLIVFTSDHGEELGDHFPGSFYNRHGHTQYEEMVHIPLIMKLPGGKHASTRVSAVARMVDIMPTILDLLSIKPKKDEMQGVSLRPLWEQGSSAPDRTAYIEAMVGGSEKKGLRTKRYKYIVSISKDTVAEHGRTYIPPEPEDRELYDLLEDPEEKKNLLKLNPKVQVAELARMFEKRIRSHMPSESGAVDSVELDQETINQLKSLGYLDQ